MRRYKRWLTLTSALGMIIGCGAGPVTTSFNVKDVGIGKVEFAPVVADLDISPKRHTITVEIEGKSTEAKLKARAFGMLLKKTKADILIEPRFKISVSNEVSRIIVISRTANYKNIRQLSDAELGLSGTGGDQEAADEEVEKGE